MKNKTIIKDYPIMMLIGPTATGKTDLALEFAKHVPVEIISVDSAMVYRGMDIGTGKPSKEQLTAVPHHLIDIRNPNEPYSAANFCHDTLKLIPEIQARQHIPLIVGGTMLYFRALLQGLSPLPSANANIRARILKEAEQLGWQALHDRLQAIDPKAALRIHPNDPQRIQRALEIYEITGNTQSFLWDAMNDNSSSNEVSNEVKENNKLEEIKIATAMKDIIGTAGAEDTTENDLVRPKIKTHIFVIMPSDRALLHQRIQERFQNMLAHGFMLEVENLYQGLQTGSLDWNLPALRAVGYRQALHYLAGEYSYEEMQARAIAATRQLAKRQITWLRSLKPKMLGPADTGLSQNLFAKAEIHYLDIKNNHSDSKKTMLHCLS